MYKLTPKIIAEITGGRYIGSDESRDIHISGAVRDNRDVKPGNLFVCIQGERTDGHLYANHAFEAGAACCIASKIIPDAKGAYVLVDSTTEAIKKVGEYYRSLFHIPVIGITGSVGKTTTKELVASTLGDKLCVLKTEKNLNNELGVPLTLLSLNPEHEVAVIEMGISDFGEMSNLAKMVRPDIFIMTNIGYSHTKELGDLNGVLRAKTEAFTYMRNDGVAIMNGDDKLLRDYDTGIRKIMFGLNRDNDYRTENIKTEGLKKLSMDVVSDSGRIHAEIPAYGIHLAELVPAAVATGHLLELTDGEICSGMASYIHVEGRSNISIADGLIIVNDCYNANPGSVKAALVSLSQLTCRHVAILGDMLNLGEQTRQLHYDIGCFAATCGINLLLCHGDEARYIYEGFKKTTGTDMTKLPLKQNINGKQEAKYYLGFESLKHDIPKMIKKGDAVLLKASRGMCFERLLPVISYF